MNLRNRMVAITAGLLVALGSPLTVNAEGDAEAGRFKAETCMGCHGVKTYFNVYPTYHVPRVGGQHAAYIVAALKAYKTGERGHRTMQAQARSLTDQDMADIAAYFAADQSN